MTFFVKVSVASQTSDVGVEVEVGVGVAVGVLVAVDVAVAVEVGVNVILGFFDGSIEKFNVAGGCSIFPLLSTAAARIKKVPGSPPKNCASIRTG